MCVACLRCLLSCSLSQLVGLFLSFYTLGDTDGALESFKKRQVNPNPHRDPSLTLALARALTHSVET